MRPRIRLYLLLVVSILVGIGAIGFYLVRTQAVGQQCPSAYATEQERQQAFVSFLNSLPTSTTPESFVEDRIDFYIAHNCIEELQKYGYDGVRQIDPKVRELLVVSMFESLSKQAPFLAN